MIEMSLRKEEMQSQIDGILKRRKLEPNSLEGKNLEEILEEIGIFHQELEYQNIELYRISNELEITKNHYYELFNDAPCAYVIFNTEGLIISSNRAFQKMLDHDASEFLDKTIQMFVHPDKQDDFYFHLQDLQKNGSTSSIQLALKSGFSEIPVKIKSNIMENSSGKFIHSTFIDISQEKEIEKELQAAKEKSEAASNAKTDFLANMSHEIRTPLNGILGFLQLLEFSGLDPRQIEFITKIKYSADVLLTVINDILDMSKIEAGKMKFENIPFNLKDCITSAVDIFKEDFYKKNILFSSSFTKELPEIIYGDPTRLRQVFINLLSNAQKFTAKGSIQIEVSSKNMGTKAHEISFKISDTGIGMSPEVLKNLFSAFSQGDSTSTRKYGGTGLGLCICRNIIHHMKGEIFVETKLGEGSTFSFNFLSEKPEGATNIEAMIHPVGLNSEDLDKDGIKILVVEDNEINRNLIIEILSINGYRCDVAIDGREALQIYQKNNYDLIFMDCQLPDMDGYEVTRKIRNREIMGKKTLIVAMTAYSLEGDSQKCISAGMDDYVSKPIDISSLVKLLERYTKEIIKNKYN